MFATIFEVLSSGLESSTDTKPYLVMMFRQWVDLFERIDEGLRQILESHQPEPLNEYVAAKITDIQVSFRDTHS